MSDLRYEHDEWLASLTRGARAEQDAAYARMVRECAVFFIAMLVLAVGAFWVWN